MVCGIGIAAAAIALNSLVLAGMDLCLTLYSVVPTEQDKGIIEFIQEAETICRIQMAESCKNATGDISM